MRTLEVRRHTMRIQPGKHLSQAGVDLARQTGASIGPFDRVITSKLPRAFETAIAMGFAVDDQIGLLGSISDAVSDEFDWTHGFPAVTAAVRKGDETARYATKLARRWHSVVAGLPEGSRTLMISHGGIVEAGAAGCLPAADHAAWGRALDYCEGIRLRHDGAGFTDIEIIRLTDTPIDGRIIRYPPPR
ncbi:MAG: histidine phosphatase family protein [Dehalococcoidia bacterium]